MKMIHLGAFVLGLVIVCGIWLLQAPDQEPLPVTITQVKTSPQTDAIGEFTLQDHLGTTYSLSQWSERRAIVVVFLGTECPLAKLYGQRLTEMAAEYESQGVQFVGINSNRQDTLAEMTHYARTHEITFPLLKDPDNTVADLFGATRTPEAFLLDEHNKIRYQGRIDDQYGVGYARASATHNELGNAIDELLAKQRISVPQTTAVGCIIGRMKRTKPHGEITYSNQISRVVQKHCESCHREGQIAPFTLTSYEDVIGWADMMSEVMVEGRMPPWHADPAHGEFSNDARMSKAEKQQFTKWIENGMPEGDAAELPAPVVYAEGWQIPEPTAVYKMPTAFEVPAKGVVPYQYFTLDPGFTEDQWVCAAEAKPGNRAVVHHLILFYVPPGRNYRPEDALFNSVAAFAPGMPALESTNGMALRIPAGSKLVFQVHYTPNGSPQTDQSEVGLVFLKPDEVSSELETEAALTFRFRIPPGAENHRVDASYDIHHDSMLFSLTPHMHYRGKSFLISATYPDGEKEVLLNVPQYDFNWQNSYVLEDPKFLPTGTKLKMVAHYDNSAGNLANPDPNATVTWGDQTWEEMMIGSFLATRAGQDLRLGPPHIEPLSDNTSRVHFRYKPEQPVEKVYLAASFNDWKETGHAMEGPNEKGFYTTTVDLKSGEHEYKFVLDGKIWKNDPGNRVFKGFYQNNVLLVD